MWLGSATKMRTPPVVKSARRSQSCSFTRIGKARGFWTRSKTASKRNVNDLTVGPVLTQTTEQILAHTQSLLKNPGASLLFGGKELENHKIPDKYGAVEPTAVFVPVVEMMKMENFGTCCQELFAPFQVVTMFNDDSLDTVLEACERVSHHLTAAIVSNDAEFQHKVVSSSVNGTSYVGRRARSTYSTV